MSDTTAKLLWNGDLRFIGINANGSETAIDGDHQAAPSPVELLLEATASCSAVDVVLILAKMRMPAARLEIDIDADRRPTPPRYVTRLRMAFDIWGDGITAEKAARAIQLSVVKYCSVFNTLRLDLKLELDFRLHATGAEGDGEYQSIQLDHGFNDDHD
jgi:putative redox protein